MIHRKEKENYYPKIETCDKDVNLDPLFLSLSFYVPLKGSKDEGETRQRRTSDQPLRFSVYSLFFRQLSGSIL